MNFAIGNGKHVEKKNEIPQTFASGTIQMWFGRTCTKKVQNKNTRHPYNFLRNKILTHLIGVL